MQSKHRQQLEEKIKNLLTMNDRLDHIKDEDSPLSNPLICELPALLETLISRGIKVDARCEFNRTPLFFAIDERNLECVSIFLKGGANPNFNTNHAIFYETPLEYAIDKGSIDIVKELLKFGANARMISETGESLIMEALSVGVPSLNVNRLDIIKELIKHGADPSQRDRKGQNSLQFARNVYARWSETKSFPDEAASLKTALDFLEQEAKRPIDCTICLEKRFVSDATALGCGHQFCNDCLNERFRIAWQHQTDPSHQACPRKTCSYQLEAVDVQAFSNNDKEILHKFDVMKLRQCLHKNPSLRICPGRDCTFIYEITEGKLPQRLSCPQSGCGAIFCSHCQNGHNPQLISCQEAARIASLSKSQIEKISDEWTWKNTKPCPSCNTRIQKNAGCQYVKCTHCQELFCWKCNVSFGKQFTGHQGSIPAYHPWHE